MTTHAAWIALNFSLVVCALSLGVGRVRGLGRGGRRTANRIAATFGVFALAAGYIWLEVGPAVDRRLAADHHPTVIPPPPREQDV
jgi:hypothetical protein